MERHYSREATPLRTEGPLTDAEVEDAAQLLLDHDPDCETLLDHGRSKVHKRYREWYASSEIADEKAANVVRKIVKSAFGAVVYAYASHEMLETLREDGSIDANLHDTDSEVFEGDTLANNPAIAFADIISFSRYKDRDLASVRYTYRGSAARYMASFRGFLDRAYETQMADMDHPLHPHHNLKRSLIGLDANESGEDDEQNDLVTRWRGRTLPDNVKTSLDTILNFWVSCARALGRSPEKSEFVRLALEHSEMLAEPASTKFQVLNPMIDHNPVGIHWHRYAGRFVARPDDLLPEVVSNFEVRSLDPLRMCHRHPSLQKGKWPRSGACPGNVPLHVAVPGQLTSEALYRHIEQEYDVDIPRDNADHPLVAPSTQMLIVQGILFAEKTVLADAPVYEV